MTLTWGDFRTQIRRSILKDPDSANWSNDSLLDFCWWALDAFAAHTAAVTSVEYTGVTDTTEYALPENQYESIESAGLVYLRAQSGAKTYLPAYSEPDRTDKDIYFEEIPAGNLVLSSAPSTGQVLCVRYFAYWNRPTTDSDTIDTPIWSHKALAHLIGAYAMTGHGVVSANIGQWDDRTDSGQPENNPLRVQQKWLMEVYEREIFRHAIQDRQNFWKRWTK